MKVKRLLIGCGLILWLTGCASSPFFPNNGQVVKSETEFGVLKAEPDVYKGGTVKLAARIVSVEPSKQGTLVVAEWLPYPQSEYDGPEDIGWVSKGLVAVYYPDKLDAEGSLYGNKFLAIGKMVGVTDSQSKLPYMTARCLHVWKTGAADIGDSADEYDISEERYCAENNPKSPKVS
ncbi:Slp family lipoprotein [Candidatus Nitronereus thalassa]|uniref:Slp family lipoprotein n=1 Tax=Candidatus Nitronereus thalassa TaxID=3020898 RepID=A0ABU3K905_9BACT|nr:Slp family lipoprotein [Candidatus Nitronereus thalassa]MDT7042861.1 Slp family lipoprotein [Candidatus Nitronereus thalassa]